MIHPKLRRPIPFLNRCKAAEFINFVVEFKESPTKSNEKQFDSIMDQALFEFPNELFSPNAYIPSEGLDITTDSQSSSSPNDSGCATCKIVIF